MFDTVQIPAAHLLQLWEGTVADAPASIREVAGRWCSSRNPWHAGPAWPWPAAGA